MISGISESDINNENTKNSDDSYSEASFPWFPSRTRRKSRLGTYRKERIKMLEDVSNINETPSSIPSLASDFKVPSVSPISGGLSSNLDSKIPCTSSTSFGLDPCFDSIIPGVSSTFPSFSDYDFGVPNVSPKSDVLSSNFPSIVTNVTSISPKPLSNFDPLIPSLSPNHEIKNSYVSPSIPISPKPLLNFDPSIPSISPNREMKNPYVQPSALCIKISSPVNVLQQSTVLKSSLKKSNEAKPAINEKPKSRELSPRKEVRFTEPAPLPKKIMRKPVEDRPASVTVNGETYRIKGELGTGGSCVVYEVFDPINPELNDTLAIKKVRLPKEAEHQYVADGYLKEIEILKKLQNHSNVIIKMFDYELVDNDENGDRVLYVVLEKGDMDLSKYMRSLSDGDKLHYLDIMACWRRILMAVREIHDEDIMHLDLKPANFLLVKCKLKLIDFGISHLIPDEKTSIFLNATSGTISYTSPETLSMRHAPNGSMGYRVSKASDVWSLGCILYRWIYNNIPFHKSGNYWQRLQDIMSLEKKVEFPERDDIPKSLLRLLQSCLEKDPKKRPTVKDLLRDLDQCNKYISE